MRNVLKSTEYRLKAEEAEQMAKAVSYSLDRERFGAAAKEWRRKEAEALEIESKT